VRVSWSREDELAWAPFGPAMAVDVAVDLDAAGEVLLWRTDVWSNGHSLRPGRSTTPTLLAAAYRADAAAPIVAINMPLATGGGSDRNATPAYDFPALEVANHRVLSMPLRTSALRSLGAFANVFAIESLVDDIAHARGEDPVAWRLRHIADPRARAVIEAVRGARTLERLARRARASAAASASRATRATARIAPSPRKWSSRTRCA
jgi:CO/xanthine dehydrogenase Mo-binding subunit